MKTLIQGMDICALAYTGKLSRRSALLGPLASGTFLAYGTSAGATADMDRTRLDAVKALRLNTGLTLDFWADITENLELGSLLELADRSRSLCAMHVCNGNTPGGL